ncbi:MAG: histidine kinase [Chitinophagaceae bacterium]|nr:histidine kinase [Chitinophagaceae bacterium]
MQEKKMEYLKAQFEKDLLQTKLDIQEEVLKNISMEIHDNIGQVMLLANVNTSILLTMPLPPEAAEIIKHNKSLLNNAIEDISQLSRSLHSDRIIELGVFNAIKHELALLQQKGLYQVRINDDLKNDDTELPAESQLIVFRMFQEISKNIIKHSRATQIEFSLQRSGNEIEVVISDNGRGFDIDADIAAGKLNGVGMRSLYSRARMIRGRIAVSSQLNEGTRVSIYIPVS